MLPLKKLLSLVSDLKKIGASPAQMDRAIGGLFTKTYVGGSMDEVADLPRKAESDQYSLIDLFGLSGRQGGAYPHLADEAENVRADAFDILATDLSDGTTAFRTETVRTGSPDDLPTSSLGGSVQGAGHYVSFGPREWRGYRDTILSPTSGENQLVGTPVKNYHDEFVDPSDLSPLDNYEPEAIEARDLIPIIDPKFDADPYMQIEHSTLGPLAERIYRRVFDTSSRFKSLPEYLKWIDGVVDDIPEVVAGFGAARPKYVSDRQLWRRLQLHKEKEKALEPVSASLTSKHNLWPGESLHDLKQERDAVKRMLSPEAKELGTSIINSKTRTVKYRSLADFDYMADWDSYIKDQPSPVKRMAAPLTKGLYDFLRESARKFGDSADETLNFASAVYDGKSLRLSHNGLTKDIPIPDGAVKFDTASFTKDKTRQYKKPPLPSYPEGFDKEMSSRPLRRTGGKRDSDGLGILPVRSWYFSDLYESIAQMIENGLPGATEWDDLRPLAAQTTTEVLRRLGLVGHKALPERYWDPGIVSDGKYTLFNDRLATATSQNFESIASKGPFESRNAAFYDKVFLEEIEEIAGPLGDAPWDQLAR